MHRAKPRRDAVLVTRRLRLRPLAEHDLGDVVAGIGDFTVARMLARVPHPYGSEDAEAFLSANTRETSSRSGIFRVIECEGRLAGGIGLGAMPRVCEFGYWLARPFWGRGLMTEAAGAFLAYAFADLGLNLVRSGFFVDNPASARVQEKLGFRPVGRNTKRSLARGTEVAHIDTVLARSRFRPAA